MYPEIIFETCRITAGSFFWELKAHLIRLKKSAEICHIDFPVSVEAIEKQILNLDLSAIELPAKLRITVSEISCRIEIHEITEIKSPKPYKIITDCFARVHPAAKYEADFYHKYALKSAQAEAIETLWFDATGVLTEGSFTNVFVVMDNQLMTPKSDKILPGIMRQWILSQDINVLEKDLTLEDLTKANEIILVNSLRGVIKVDHCNEWVSGSDIHYQKIKSLLEADNFY